MSTRLATRMSLLTAAFVAGLALSFTPITPVHADEDPVVRQPRVRVAPPPRRPHRPSGGAGPHRRARSHRGTGPLRAGLLHLRLRRLRPGGGSGPRASAGRLSRRLHDLRRLCTGGRCADLLRAALLRADLLQRLRWLRPAGRSPVLLGGADCAVLARARLLSLKESQRPVAVRRIEIPDPPSNPSTHINNIGVECGSRIRPSSRSFLGAAPP